MTEVAVRIEATEAELLIWFGSAATPERFDWRWLRDHGEDPESFAADNRQRLVDTFAIPADLRGTATELSDAEAGAVVQIEWSHDLRPTWVSVATLRQVASLDDTELSPTLWDSATAPDPTPHTVADLLSDDDVLRDWLDGVERYGFATLTGFEGELAEAEVLARRIAYPRHTIFGSMWPLSSELRDHDDSAYSQTFLAPHTDGTYCHDAPGLQMFCCVDRDGDGGESILVDGFAVAEKLRRERPELFATLAAVLVPAHYIETGIELRASHPTIRLDRAGRVRQVSFNNYDRSPFRLPQNEMDEFYEAYGEWNRLVNDPANQILIRLDSGDVLLFDNWRTLHGRAAYTGSRFFVGCYHNREDFESRRRTLASKI